jgi:outer membrane receptor protein involved in Fe transport
MLSVTRGLVARTVRTGATLAAFDAQYSRGNENNADPEGKVPGYAVVALDGSWNITPEWQLFARVDNLFNRTYQNFGILGANYFRGPAIRSMRPRRTGGVSLAGRTFGAWIGIQYRLDRGTGSR